MNTGVKTFLLLGLLGSNNLVFAEGNCPEGQYPIGDSSAHGCAPVPGYRNIANSSQNVIRFEVRWGAIATDDTKGIVGAVKNVKSKRSANKAALQQCKLNGGGKNCEVTLTYYNQCSAVAWGDTSRAAAGRAGQEQILPLKQHWRYVIKERQTARSFIRTAAFQSEFNSSITRLSK